MRVFTREQMNHQDIDQAFAAHIHSPKSSPRKVTAPKSLFSPDNLIIVVLILLLLLEGKETPKPPTS